MYDHATMVTILMATILSTFTLKKSTTLFVFLALDSMYFGVHDFGMN